MCFLLVLHLRQKLGVTIHHLIGSNMEPLLLGYGDSTKSPPQSHKAIVQGQYIFFVQHLISWHDEVVFTIDSVSFDVLILNRTNVRIPEHGLSFDCFFLKAFVKVKVAMRHCRHHL